MARTKGVGYSIAYIEDEVGQNDLIKISSLIEKIIKELIPIVKKLQMKDLLYEKESGEREK